MLRRRHVLTGAPARLERRLAAALRADRRARRMREWASRLAAATVVFFFVLLFAWLMAGSVLPLPERTVGRVMVLGSAAGLLGSALLGLLTVGRTVDARKATTTLQLVRALKSDMRAEATLRVELDLRPYHRGTRLARTGSVFSARRTATYLQEWLRAQVVLADGSTVELALADRVKWKLKARRRGARTRERLSPVATLRVRPAKVYGTADAAAARLDGEGAPFTVRSVRARGRTVEVRAALPGTSRFDQGNVVSGRLGAADEGRWLLMLLRWTYAALAPRRA